MKNEETKKQLAAFADVLKANGFAVLVSTTHPFEWLHFEKYGQFGYVQPNYFGGFDFSSTHKPNSKWGTGLGVFTAVDLTIEAAEQTMRRIGSWNGQIVDVKTYKSPDDFIHSTNNKWAQYYAA